MLKKGLIGLVVIAVLGGSYFGYSQYQNYQQKEQARLIKERNEYVVRWYKEIHEDAAKAREDEKQFYEERRKRIEAGTAKIELIEGTEKTGERYRYTLIDARKEGKYLIWYKSGRQLSESNYKDNLLNGEYLTYYDNENSQLKRKNFYLNGRLEGEQFSWYESGQLSSKALFSQENHKLNYGVTWHMSGVKKSESKFDADKNKFVTQFWYENGNLEWEFEENQRNEFDGVMIRWYESGQIKSKKEYKNGKSKGLCQNWNEEGELISQNMIYDGLVIGNDGFGKCE